MKNLRFQNLKNQRGFSLIELMIVIAIIGLLIGVGVPAWRYMTITANENTTIQALDNIEKAQLQFAGRKKGDFATFDELVKETGFNEKFKGEQPAVNGFVFEMKVEKRSPGKSPSWSVNADPVSSSEGTRHFYRDSVTSTTRVSEDGPANPQSPPL